MNKAASKRFRPAGLDGLYALKEMRVRGVDVIQLAGDGEVVETCMSQVLEAGAREQATPPRTEESARTDDAEISGTRTETNVVVERSDHSMRRRE